MSKRATPAEAEEAEGGHRTFISIISTSTDIQNTGQTDGQAD